MKAKWIAVLLGILFSSGCGNAAPVRAPVRPATTQAAVRTTKAPQSLEEGMRAQGYTPVALAHVGRAMTSSMGTPVVVTGNQIRVNETAGWKSDHTQFARKGDVVFIVAGQPTTIVDRHVPGGCLTFAGGRGWFEDVTYELPAGTTYGGIVKIAYEDHVEITDYSDKASDGSPCPQPAID